MTQRNKRIVIVAIALLPLLLWGGVWIQIDEIKRCQFQRRMVDKVWSFARNKQIDWLDQLASSQHHKLFERTLTLQVHKGDLALILAHFEQGPTNIHTDLRQFAKTNGVKLAFTRSSAIGKRGRDIEIYAESADKALLENYILTHNGLLTNRIR